MRPERMLYSTVKGKNTAACFLTTVCKPLQYIFLKTSLSQTLIWRTHGTRPRVAVATSPQAVQGCQLPSHVKRWQNLLRQDSLLPGGLMGDRDQVRLVLQLRQVLPPQPQLQQSHNQVRELVSSQKKIPEWPESHHFRLRI